MTHCQPPPPNAYDCYVLETHFTWGCFTVTIHPLIAHRQDSNSEQDDSHLNIVINQGHILGMSLVNVKWYLPWIPKHWLKTMPPAQSPHLKISDITQAEMMSYRDVNLTRSVNVSNCLQHFFLWPIQWQWKQGAYPGSSN